MQLIEKDNLIKVPGGTIWSQIIFTEVVKNETPLIILHGGPGGTHNLLKYAFKGLAQYFPIIIYDQLGSGNSKLGNKVGSDNSSLWQVARFVEELNCLIDFYHFDNLNLFGTSWGSTLALEYILTKPNHNVKRLILGSPLISTPIWIEDMHKLRLELPKEIQDALNHGEQTQQTDTLRYKEAEEFFENKHFLRKELLDNERLEILKHGAGDFNHEVYQYMWGINEFYPKGNLINYDRFNDLNKLQISTLFTCGEFDEVTSDTLKSFHMQVPNSQIHIFKNCSHRASFENPQEYCAILKQFLQ